MPGGQSADTGPTGRHALFEEKTMLPDMNFLLVAIPAVILVGFSKGGMGEALALMGVPLLSLVVPPVQAAALLLPILIAMDMGLALGLAAQWRPQDLLILLPGALAGIAIGWATAAVVPRDALRLIIGLIAVLFALRYACRSGGCGAASSSRRARIARFWPACSAPCRLWQFRRPCRRAALQVYALPCSCPRAITPAPWCASSPSSMPSSSFLFRAGSARHRQISSPRSRSFPFAVVATKAGAFFVRRMKPQTFYPFMYMMAFLAGLKLVHESLSTWLAPDPGITIFNLIKLIISIKKRKKHRKSLPYGCPLATHCNNSACP